MILAGIDWSMNSPAICVYDTTKELKFNNCVFFNYANWGRSKQFEGQHGNIIITKQPTFSCNEERFKNAHLWAKSVLTMMKVENATIEGYSYGSVGKLCEIGECTAYVKMALFECRIPFLPIAPDVPKKAETGKGNAKKDKLYQSLLEHEPEVDILRTLGYDSSIWKDKINTPWDIKPIDDIVDSYFILKQHHIILEGVQ